MFRRIPNAKKVKVIKLRVGVLSLVDEEALRFALRVASQGTHAEGARIVIEREWPRLRCRECGFEWDVNEDSIKKVIGEHGVSPLFHLYPDVVVNFFRCPSCGSNDVEIVRGSGVIVDSIEVDTGSGEQAKNTNINKN